MSKTAVIARHYATGQPVRVLLDDGRITALENPDSAIVQTSQPAVSRVSKPADSAIPTDQPTWKSAIQQVWKPALQAGAPGQSVTLSSCAENVWVAPPLVDLQVNGYGGVDFQQDNLTAEELLSAARQLRAMAAPAGC